MTRHTSAHDGTLHHVDGRPVLRFERRYPHPVERVWRAVTEPAELAQWFPSAVVGDRSVGAELTFLDEAQRAAARDAGEPTRVDGPAFRGRVVVFDPPTVFSFTWGGELLRFELAPDGDGTVLVFTQVVSHPSTVARNCAGWLHCLGTLGRLLDEQVPVEQRAWPDVYADCVARVGPPLGVPGEDGSMTWEGATHVPADRVLAVVASPADWGGADRAADGVRWEAGPSAYGTVFRLTHPAIGADAGLAATWHALMVQLDLYLAAGQLVPVDASRWIADYAELLGVTSR